MTKAVLVPGLDVLGDFAIAAANNSRRLLEDAELLASRGRWPGAYSYAILAFEEAGKAWLWHHRHDDARRLQARVPVRGS